MSYRDVVLADNPAAYWRLGESSGSTAYDETSNGYDATYRGDPTLGVSGAAKLSDTAIDCDGSGDYVDAGDIIDPMAGSCSFELWVNMDQLETERGLMLKDDGSDGWGVQLGDGTADGNLRFFQRGASTVILATTTDPVATGQWHHIVAVYDSSTGDRQIYVDAALEASDTIATGGFASASAKLAIAARRDGGDAVDGQVDEVAVYTAALSASQIQQHYDEARKVELDAHVSVLEHKRLFPGTFEAHTVESVHSPLGIKIGLPAHTSILAHQDQSDSDTGTDNSKEGQAKALKSTLGYGWGVPDPKASANEKIETPRESWPTERTSEAKRLMQDQGVDSSTSEGVGEAMRKLGEDISHDVRTNLQRYEWHANTHTHREVFGLAQALFVVTGYGEPSLVRLRADTGAMEWGIDSDTAYGYHYIDVDTKNERIFPMTDQEETMDAYNFQGRRIWRVRPFRDLPDVAFKPDILALSWDREKVYTYYQKGERFEEPYEAVFIELDAADGTRRVLSVSHPTESSNTTIFDVTEDYIYHVTPKDTGGFNNYPHVRKMSRADGSLVWETKIEQAEPYLHLCITERMVWVQIHLTIYMLKEDTGEVLDSHTLPEEEDSSPVRLWKDHDKKDSVFSVVYTDDYGGPYRSSLHYATAQARSMRVDENIWIKDGYPLYDHVVRDGEGNFFFGATFGGYGILKLDSDLNRQWQEDNLYHRMVMTDQGYSARW
jgi:hypothetical protein